MLMLSGPKLLSSAQRLVTYDDVVTASNTSTAPTSAGGYVLEVEPYVAPVLQYAPPTPQLPVDDGSTRTPAAAIAPVNPTSTSGGSARPGLASFGGACSDCSAGASRTDYGNALRPPATVGGNLTTTKTATVDVVQPGESPAASSRAWLWLVVVAIAAALFLSGR